MAKKKSIFDRLDESVQEALTIPKPPKSKKKGGAKAPPPSRRAPRPATEDATVWAAEQTIQPWELPVPKKVPKKPKTFQEYMRAHAPPVPWQERERIRKKRVRWAEAATIDPKARRKLAETMTPDRQLDIVRRGEGQPGEVLDRESFNRMVLKNRLEKQLRQTKDKDKRRQLEFALEAIENPAFNPLRAAGGVLGQGIRDVAGVAGKGVRGLYEGVFDEEQRAELAEYFREVQDLTGESSEKIAREINEYLGGRSKNLEAMGVPVPPTLKKIAASSVRTAVESTVGLGPGLVYTAGNPQEAWDEYVRYLKSYYGALARGETSQLEAQGITPGLFDVLGVASLGLGTAGRVGALGRTGRFRGPMRISSEGRLISRPEAYARAAVLRQEPVPILGTETTTMGRRVPERAIQREEPVRAGTIEEGDRVEYRVGDEIKETRASQENGLAGLDAPDPNNPIVRQVHGEDAEVLSAYRMGEFEQRMVPRSPVGEVISDLYAWLRPDTGRERGLLSGKGRRTKLVREAKEVQEDRLRGQIKAFMKDHRDIQKNVVLSTAYDRSLRFRDPATQIPQEIASRRQRGLDKTKEQKQVIASLEQALEQVENPSPKLQASILAGRLLSWDTENFLVNRGLLTPQRALQAKLAAERWLKPGHLLDEPLSSARRGEVEAELLEHFGGDEDKTRLAMAYTDTLARAWGEQNGRNPADWYEENIRSVETLPEEQIEALGQDPALLRQERDAEIKAKATPRPNETFVMNDPETGQPRLARMIDSGWTSEALAHRIEQAEQSLAQDRERYTYAAPEIPASWPERGSDWERKWDALPEDADVVVFHATDPGTAEAFAANGIDPMRKPGSLGRSRYERGEYAEFQPGAGLAPGLTVGAEPWSISGYGRAMIAIRARKGDILVSPEQAALGAEKPSQALRVNDAQIHKVIPTNDIKVLDLGGRVPTMETLSQAVFPDKPGWAHGRSMIERGEQTVTALRAKMDGVDNAIVSWVYGPNAGERITVPLSEVPEASHALRGWFSGIAIKVEQMPEKVGRQQVEALKKAPGVKADEWKWLNMDEVIRSLFYGNVKSVTKDELKRAIRSKSAIFSTEKLDREYAMYETDYDVTLPGPKGDYHETLVYYPYRVEIVDPEDQLSQEMEYGHGEMYETAYARWKDEARDDAYDAWRSDREDWAYEEWHRELEREHLNDEISDEEYQDRVSDGPEDYELERIIGEPDEYDLEQYMGEPDYDDLVRHLPEAEENALYTAPHFESSDREQENYAGNLMAHARQSHRWVGGAPIRTIEEFQSDWHQEAGRAIAYTEEGEPIRRGYKSQERRTETEALIRKSVEAHEKAMAAHTEMTRKRDEAYSALALNLGTEMESVWGTSNIRGTIVAAYPEQHLFEVRWNEAGQAESGKLISDGLDFTRMRPVEGTVARKPYDEMLKLEAAHAEAEAAYNTARQTADYAMRARGVADAPYAGAAWEELLFRETVRQAVSQGETRISWTTAEQQAERYNKLLASKVSRLEWDGETLTATTPEGESQSWPWTQFKKTPDEPKQVALSRALGSGLSRKLTDLLEEKKAGPAPEARHDLFQVERPARDEYGNPMGTAEALELPVDEFMPGDIIVLSVPDDPRWGQLAGLQKLQFQVNNEGRIIDRWNTINARAVAEKEGWDFPIPFEEEGLSPMRFRAFAEEAQTQVYEQTYRRTAVLEGEEIQVGGGGFIGAYDQRLVRYAKKYLGAEPRKVPLDDLVLEVEYPGTPSRPARTARVGRPSQYMSEGPFAVEVGGQPIMRPLSSSEPLPVYRVRAGDTVLAESEILSSAIEAAFDGGANAGVWPTRIRYNPENSILERWEEIQAGGTPGSPAPSYQNVVRRYETSEKALEHKSAGWRESQLIQEFGYEGVAEGAGEVWVVDIPEKFALDMHEKGSPLFQRRRGSILGLARLTDEGANIYLNRDAADLATWTEEAAHAYLPTYLDDLTARQDPRADYMRERLGLQPSAKLTTDAHEELVRLLQVWLIEGATPAAQMRSLMQSLSSEMKMGLEGGASKVVRNAEERKKFDRLLADPQITSFFREMFDVAPYKDLDPGPIYFQTMKTMGRVARPGTGKLQRTARSILPSRRPITKHPNTMRAWESGNFDVGPDMTAHYANAELRTRMQDEQARRTLKYMENLEIVNGVPTLKPGYQVYNYYAVRRANARIDEIFRRSERYGDIGDSEEPLLSPDPASGSIIDMDPEDFADFSDEVIASILKEEALYDTIADAEVAIGDRFLELVRDGKVGQIPNDVAETFLSTSGAGFTLASTNTAVRLAMTALRIPSMLARWRMIGKFAYPVTNAAFTGLLVGINQGPLAFLNFYKQYATLQRSTRIRLLQEVGVGVAELVDVPELIGQTRIERWQAREQAAFRRVMHALSTPESHVRLAQMKNDLADAGYRTDADIVRLLDMAKEGGSPAALRLLNQVGRNAEDGVVRFRGMTPDEQLIVRDLLFVYGWLRSAARFTLRFPLERPVTAAAMFHIGQYGWEKLQEDFYSLAWEQQGAIPIGKRREGEETMVKLLDLSQLFPFKSGAELLRIPAQYLGLLETGLRPASFADLLSPSAETAMRAIYGQDPRFATGFWEGMKYDADPRNLPGVFWIARLIDPSLTGTKLRGDRSRWNVLINLFAGQVAPYEVKQSVEYERWLDQQPSDLRTLIREQNDAEAFARIGEAAYKVEGGALSIEQIRAINADSAYGIYTSLLQSKKRREKKDSGYYLSSVERAASKAKMMQEYYPDAFAQAQAEASGLDPIKDAADAETYIEIMDDAWEENVSDVKSEIRTAVKDNLGYEMPESTKVPLPRWERDLRWLQTATPESVRRIKEAMERNHVTPTNQLALAPIIEDEMRRAVTP